MSLRNISLKREWRRGERQHHALIGNLSKIKRGGRTRARRAGLTLIEILVVVGILALLAALLFPTFARVREGGKRSNCLSNLKQIALGVAQYTQDNDHRYPPLPPSPPDGSEGWAITVADSVKNDAVFQCPSETKLADEGFTDYWINAGLLGKSEVRVRFPSTTILNGDGETSSVDYALAEADPAPPHDPADWQKWSVDGAYAQRHLEGANYSFTDGHVKWLKPNQVSLTSSDGSQYSLPIN